MGLPKPTHCLEMYLLLSQALKNDNVLQWETVTAEYTACDLRATIRDNSNNQLYQVVIKPIMSDKGGLSQ